MRSKSSCVRLPEGTHRGYFAQYRTDRLKAVGIPSTACVLDFGCGVGNLTELLVDNFSVRQHEVRTVLTSAGIADVTQKYIGFFPLGAQTMTSGIRGTA